MKKLLLFCCLLFSLSAKSQSGYTCATARTISSLPYTDTYTTCGSANNISSGTCNDTYSSGEDVIYVISITTAPLTVSMSLSGVTNGYGSIQVSSTCTFGSCLGNISGSGTSISGNVTFSTNGTYYIKIDSWAPPACNPYTLNIDPPPTNDLICNATPLTVNGACVNSNNTMATYTAASDAASCINESNTVWYYFDATDDSMTITSVNTYTYGEIAVFSSSNNTCTGTKTEVACTTQTTATKIELEFFTLVPGKRYFIMVDGWSTYTGGSCVSVIETPDPPPAFGSSCINARVLFPKTSCGPDPTTQAQPNDNMANVLMANIANGTGGLGVGPSCDFTETYLPAGGAAFANGNNCAATAKKATWVEFKATSNTTTLNNNSTTSGNADLCYTLYTGSCSALVQSGCYTVAKGGSQAITTTTGTTYFIMITAGNSNVNPNNHWLCITSPTNTPTNSLDNCSQAYSVSDGVPVVGHTAMATQDGNANLCAGTSSVPNNNVWYKWTTPASWTPGSSAFVHVYNQDCNSTAGVQIDVYNSTVNCGNVASGTPPCVAYTAPENTETFYASWVPTIGATYFITIDGSCGTVCSFDLQINNTATILPIRLTDFKAIQENAVIKLLWETASEYNNDKFLVERSTDCINFQLIGTVKGAGNSSVKNSYHMYDENPLPGVIYYRLKQVDYNGSFAYSKIVSFNTELNANEINFSLGYLRPVPAATVINYPLYTNYKNEEVDVKIFDVLGKVVLSEKKNVSMGENLLSTGIESLHQGTYILQIMDASGNKATKRFIK